MITDADIKRVVERIVAFENPDAIYAFGSCAKSVQHDRSDLDLLVIQRTELPRRLRGRDVVGMLAEMPFDIDVLFVTPEELAADASDPRTLLGTIVPTSIEVYRRHALAEA
jgi:predicted nucleotidyltransferase